MGHKMHKDRPNAAHGNKLRTYRQYKSQTMQESYFNIIKSKSERSMYNIKLGLSAHTLDIEKLIYTTKWNRIPTEQRICKDCTLNEIEDEAHFLIVCPRYNDARLRLKLNWQIGVIEYCIKYSTWYI